MSNERDESLEEFLERISAQLGWARSHDEFNRRFYQFLLAYRAEHGGCPPGEEWTRVTNELLVELFADHPAVIEYQRIREALFPKGFEKMPSPLEMQGLVEELIRHLWENISDPEAEIWWSDLFRLHALTQDLCDQWESLCEVMPDILLPEEG